MNKKYVFKWVIYPSKLGKKKGVKKVEFIEKKLPVNYRGNPYYKLELHTSNKKYRNDGIFITKIKAEIIDETGARNKISNDYFENDNTWLLGSSLKNAFSDWKDLTPLIFWVVLLVALLNFGLVYGQQTLSVAISSLINENASKTTVFLGSVFFCVFCLSHVFFPDNLVKVKSFFLFCSNQFFNLVIGASSFCLASYFISLLNGSDSSVGGLESLAIIIICFLIQYARSFYITLNNFVDNKARWCIWACLLAFILSGYISMF